MGNKIRKISYPIGSGKVMHMSVGQSFNFDGAEVQIDEFVKRDNGNGGFVVEVYVINNNNSKFMWQSISNPNFVNDLSLLA